VLKEGDLPSLDPVLATVIGGFAALTMLTKNSFLDEIRKGIYRLSQHGKRH
jgi:ABC-type microcin C transport system permease subunit YejB